MSTEHNHNPAVVRPTDKSPSDLNKNDMIKLTHVENDVGRPSSFDVSRICCLCSRNEGPMLSIFEGKSKTDVGLQEKIFYCTSIKVSASEEFPSLICETCITMLEMFYSFKRRCIDVNTKLLKSGLRKPANSKVNDSQVTPTQPASKPSANVARISKNSCPIAILPSLLQKPESILSPVLQSNVHSTNASQKLIHPSCSNRSQVVNVQQATKGVPTKSCLTSNISSCETVKASKNDNEVLQPNPLECVSCSYTNDVVTELENTIPQVVHYETIYHTESYKIIESPDVVSFKSEEVVSDTLCETKISGNTQIDVKFNNTRIHAKCKDCHETMKFCKHLKQHVCTICQQRNTKKTVPKRIISKLLKYRSQNKC